MVLCRYYISMAQETLYTYLERIETLMRAQLWQSAHEEGLQPIQLQMLDYLGRCNRYSNHSAAVAAYFQLTKGTVSQSLKALETKGLIRREPDAADRRKVHWHPTAEGEAVLARALPPAGFDAELSAESVLVRQLDTLLRHVQHTNGWESFGVCHTCRHFQHEGENQFRCGLTLESLTSSDTDLICREHIWPEPTP